LTGSELSKADRLEAMPRTTTRWAALRALMRPDAARWAGLAVLVALASAAALAGPLLIRQIIDRAESGATTSTIAAVALTFLAVAVVAQLVNVAVTWAATVTAWHTTNALRVQLARHTLALDHAFHRSHTPGELVQRIDGDTTSVSDFLGMVVPKASGALLTTAGMIVVIAIIDWRIAACMAVYLVVATAVLLRGRHRAIAEAADEMDASSQLYGGIEERLTAAEDLRSNGALDHVMWRFMQESGAYLAAAVRRSHAFMRLWWGVEGAVAAGSSLALISGALLVRAGSMSLGTAFAVFQYVLLMSRPLEDLVEQLETVQKANGAMIRVAALLDERPAVADTGTTNPPRGPLEVAFERVSFAYEDGHPVLDGVDVVIPAGATVGIVGQSGGGKTTLSRLVLRLVEPTHGRVLVGGVPITEIPQPVLRRRVAAIPQEVELFAGSLRDNVTMFDPAVRDSVVRDALAATGLKELAEGDLDRPLGGGGLGMSAGEAQLVALSRVWLRDPDVLVLDEATARVDPATEERIDAAVTSLMRGRTTLIIAHRLSTLHQVDYIMVVEHGTVVEFGARDDLVGDDDSRFRQLLDIAGDDESLEDHTVEEVPV
jgi:ATP-binding cassette, subfamily B, bacterial